MTYIKKISLYLSLIYFIFSNFVYVYADAEQDEVKTHITYFETTDTSLPSTGSEYQKGRLGKILSLIFDSNGFIQSKFINIAVFGWIYDAGKVYTLTSGNVGIGTTNPSQKLHVAGNTYISGSLTLGGSLSGDSITTNTIDSSEIEDNTITETDISDSFKSRDSDLLDGTDSSQFMQRDTNNTTTGLNFFTSNKGASSYIGSNNNYGLQAYSSDGGAAGISLHRGGYYAVNMGLDPDNVFRIGGRSAPPNLFQMDMGGNTTIAGGLYIDGQRVIDDGGTWHRSYGNSGWYNETYGGGWYMSDYSRIRSYGNKNIYHNDGIMRTDGTLSVGSESNPTFIATNGGEVRVTKNADINANGLASLELRSIGNSPIGISFHRPGIYASKLVFDTDNVFKFGGWSDGAAVGKIQAGSIKVSCIGNCF